MFAFLFKTGEWAYQKYLFNNKKKKPHFYSLSLKFCTYNVYYPLNCSTTNNLIKNGCIALLLISIVFLISFCIDFHQYTSILLDWNFFFLFKYPLKN